MVLLQGGEIKIKRMELGQYAANCYIVSCPKTNAAVIIDAPDEAERILAEVRGLSVRYLLITHSHRDHIGAISQLKAGLGVPLAIHPLDAAPLPVPPDLALADGQTINLGTVNLQVIHTPGHSPGSVCLLTGKYLFSGDTIFPGGPGATRTPQNLRQIVDSITTKLFPLGDDTVIYPGHGLESVLSKEKGEFAIFASRPWNPQLCGDVLWRTS